MQVEHERPVFHITQVESDRIVPGQIRTSAHLPQAGNTRLNRQPAPHMVTIHGGLLRQGWSWSYQGHIAVHYVDELRQFVKRPPAQPRTGPGDPRVVAKLEQDAVLPGRAVLAGRPPQIRSALLGVDDHGAELVDGEHPAVLTHPGLPEERRTAVIEL